MNKTGVRRGVIAGTVLLLLGVLFGVRRESVYTTFNPGLAYEIAATQDIAYKAVPATRDTWGKADSLANTIAKVRTTMDAHRGDGYVLKLRATEWSFKRTLRPAMTRLDDHLLAAKVGDVWLVKALSDGFVEKTTKVDLNPAKVIDTEGTLPIDIVAGTVWTKFPTVQNWGIYVCKRIAGTNTWSQHAYRNAIDLGGPVELLDKVANYLYDLTRKGYIPVSQILWRGRDMVSGSPVSDHDSHIHVSGRPLLSGTPCQ